MKSKNQLFHFLNKILITVILVGISTKAFAEDFKKENDSDPFYTSFHYCPVISQIVSIG
jgi:hypothetical protein